MTYVDVVDSDTWEPQLWEGRQVKLFGSFSDPGETDTHEAEVDWGEGPFEQINLSDYGNGDGDFTDITPTPTTGLIARS